MWSSWQTRYLRRGSGPSYLWQEVTKRTTTGTHFKRQFKTVRRWIRYGTLSRRALNNQLHFGISETHIWQTSDKTNRRQWLTWISTSSRLSGGANGRRKLRRSEWSTCCTMPPSTTRYISLYKSQNPPHWRTRWSLKRQRLMSITFSSTKTIKLPMGEQTVHLPTITHCYLLTLCLKDGPVATVIMANIVANVANLMSEATVPRMGKLAIIARVLIISKPFLVPRLQPRWHRALTEARSHSRRDMVPWGSTVAKAKEVATINIRRRRPQRSRQSRKHMQWHSKNSVPSGVTTTSGGERENHGNVSSKTVLSGPEEEGTYNRFSCFAVHSKMSQSTNAKSKPVEGLYTDTDPDDRSEIITDVTIRMPGKAGTMMMEVKVDPGAQPSCIPLHKFKTLFPHLCRDRLPKEGLLDNTQNEFQSYNGGDMTCYGHLLIDVKDTVTKKYHPIRFYVMNTDVPRILISHAASYWLGLVRVLCDNKAPRIKRQVASIDKKSDFRAKSGHFRTSSPNTASSSQKKQTTLKTVTSGKAHVPSPRMHNFEDA